jgi:hypothetical protein
MYTGKGVMLGAEDRSLAEPSGAVKRCSPWLSVHLQTIEMSRDS